MLARDLLTDGAPGLFLMSLLWSVLCHHHLQLLCQAIHTIEAHILYVPHDRSPYTLCFITGNIRVCRGCRQKYTKPCTPPMDLCIQHQEWQQFTPPGASAAQVRYGNVYYHCNIPCIQAQCPSFTADMLIIPAQIALFRQQILQISPKLLGVSCSDLPE